MKSNTIQNLLTHSRKALEGLSDSPALDAELLLAHCLKKSRTYCHTWPEHELTPSEQDCFKQVMALRKDDYPVAYILGKKSFWTFEVAVTPDVLIPRPETELLVEVALEKLAEIKNPKILDLGTGSGVIALALASERPDALIVACDSSKKALDVAQRNANQLNLERQIEFKKSNWLSEINPKSVFDLIVSNPPYIEPDDPHLKLTIKHEPIAALVANDKGMSDIYAIIKQSQNYLNKNGWLILEHGYDQGLKVKNAFEQYAFTHAKNREDLANLTRITLAQKT